MTKRRPLSLLHVMFGIPTNRRRPGVPQFVKDERRIDRNAISKARRLAAGHDITIERDSDAYWVHSSLDDTARDPIAGQHFCSDGREVLAAVEAIVEALTTTIEGESS